MRLLVRRHPGFFLAVTAAAFALRLFFLWKFRFVAGDSLIYGDIAKNWIRHGVFALTEDGVPAPTYIRLPGYPAFLALIWKIFGLEHYTAVMVAQMFFDIGTAYALAALARLAAWEGAALVAFLLYALNPFTANYVATPLTEVLAVFFTALALLFAVKCLLSLQDEQRWDSRYWVCCGLAIAAGTMLRPDAGILLAGIGGYLFLQLLRLHQRRIVFAALLLIVSALAPLVPWTLRNWRVFHVFEPLAPRYANSPSEFVPAGFNRWVKTWLLDYVSVDEIYWHVPGESIDISKLPTRAFDSALQRARTEQLFAAYNATCDSGCGMTPELDSQFASLAAERIRHAHLRYYCWLPLARLADMWLRPRVEALPLEAHWWHFFSDPSDSAIGIALGAINLAYLVAALIGAARRRLAYAGLFILWIALRCAFLATLENPEPRYTLECWPVVCVFAAANFKRRSMLRLYIARDDQVHYSSGG